MFDTLFSPNQNQGKSLQPSITPTQPQVSGGSTKMFGNLFSNNSSTVNPFAKLNQTLDAQGVKVTKPSTVVKPTSTGNFLSDAGSYLSNVASGVGNALKGGISTVENTLNSPQVKNVEDTAGKAINTGVSDFYHTVLSGQSGSLINAVTNYPVVSIPGIGVGTKSFSLKSATNIVDQLFKLPDEAMNSVQNSIYTASKNTQNGGGNIGDKIVSSIAQAGANVQKFIQPFMQPTADETSLTGLFGTEWRGIQEGITSQYLGDSQKVMDTFNTPLDHPVTQSGKISHTVGDVVGNVLGFIAGGEVLKAAGFGKAVMPVLFATLGQTSSPASTTALQRIEKAPVDAITGWLFGGMHAPTSVSSTISTTAKAGSLMGAQQFITSVIQGQKGTDALKTAGTMFAIGALFHAAGSATGLISAKLFDSQLKQGVIDMSPQEVQHQVMNTDLKGTPAGNSLMKASLDAQSQGKNVRINMTAAQKAPLAHALNLKTPSGISFTAELVDAPAQVTSSQQPEQSNVQEAEIVNQPSQIESTPATQGSAAEVPTTENSTPQGNTEGLPQNSLAEKSSITVPTDVKPSEKPYFDYINKNYNELLSKYVQTYNTRINTDDIKELLKPAGYDSTQSQAVVDSHRAAGAFANKLFQHVLESPAHGEKTMLQTIGGTGSGKTSVSLDTVKNNSPYGIINDSTGQNYAFTKRDVQEALDKGYQVDIKYVHRPALDAFSNGVLLRDRHVSMSAHVNSHTNAPSNYLKLYEDFKDNPNAHFEAFHNETGKEYRQLSLAEVKQITYNKERLKQRLHEKLNQHYEARNTPAHPDYREKLTENKYNAYTKKSDVSGITSTNNQESTQNNVSEQTSDATNLIREALYAGDETAAKAIHDSFSSDLQDLPSFESLSQEIAVLREQNIKELEGIKKELLQSNLSTNPDDPTNQLLKMAQQLSDHFSRPKAKYKITGVERTYQSADGKTMLAGGSASQAFDRLIHATDIEGFKKNIAVLHDKFNSVFTQMYDTIRSGGIDGADYQSFRTYYESIQGKRFNAAKTQKATDNQAGEQLVQSAANREPVQERSNAQSESTQSAQSSRQIDSHVDNSEDRQSESGEQTSGNNNTQNSGNELDLNRGDESGNSKPDDPKRYRASGNEGISKKELAEYLNQISKTQEFKNYIKLNNGDENRALARVLEDRLSSGKMPQEVMQAIYENTPTSQDMETGELLSAMDSFRGEHARQLMDSLGIDLSNNKDIQNNEGVKIAPVLDQFINEDVLPKTKSFVPWLQDLNHEIKSAIMPTTLADPKALNMIFTYKGENDFYRFLNREKYKRFTLLGKQVNLIKFWDGMSKEQHQVFYDNFENVKQQGTLEQIELDKLYRQRYDNIYNVLSEFKNINKIENYFKRMWEQNGESEKSFNEYNRKRGLQGDMSWTKKRFYKFYMDAVKAGKIAKETNPEIITQIAEENAMRFKNAQVLWKNAKSAGKLKLVKLGHSYPPGFARIDDRISKMYLPSEISVNEYFDQQVWDKLHDFGESLGIANERKMKTGRGRLGYTSPVMDKIVTKFATPTSVIAHELGHQLDYKYNLQSKFITDETMNTELHDLAVKRYEGQDDTAKSFKQYVQKPAEKMAVMLESYIHAPDVFKTTAPTAYKAFDDLVRSTHELKPLTEIKPSIVMGHNQGKVSVGGLVLGGEWVAEENLARLINRHLSPDKFSRSVVGRALQSQKAILNGFELSFSAFHPTFLGIDSFANKLSLLSRQTVQGNIKSLPRTFGTTAPALIDYYLKGRSTIHKALEADPVALAALQTAATAGSKIQTPEGIEATVLDNFNRNIRQGNYISALFRSPYALVEATMRPLFSDIIPRAKLGVFFENYGQALIDNAENLTAGTTDEQTLAREIWRDVEDRMGELNYENLFWNNSFKGAIQVMMRAPAWFKGTLATFGGGAKDNALFLSDLTKYIVMKGEKPQFTQRGQYLWSMIFATMVIGALYQYLHTKKWPSTLKDYFMPMNGAVDTAGNNIRVVLPTYFKDAISMMNDPLKYVENKTAPEINLMWEALSNQDFFGNEIRNPTDPAATQITQTLNFLFQNGLSPFSYQQATQQPTLQSKLESLSGVMKAPAKFIQSAKQQAVSNAYTNQMGKQGPQTPEQQAVSQLKAKARTEIKQNGWRNSPSFQQLLKDGTLKTQTQRRNFIKSAYQNSVQRLESRLPRSTRAQLNTMH